MCCDLFESIEIKCHCINIIINISFCFGFFSSFFLRFAQFLTWTVDESLFSGSLAQSRAVTTKLYIGIVSRSSACCVRIVPFDMIMKSLFSSPAVILYSMRPLYPAKKIHKKKSNKTKLNKIYYNYVMF